MIFVTTIKIDEKQNQHYKLLSLKTNLYFGTLIVIPSYEKTKSTSHKRYLQGHIFCGNTREIRIDQSTEAATRGVL